MRIVFRDIRAGEPRARPYGIGGDSAYGRAAVSVGGQCLRELRDPVARPPSRQNVDQILHDLLAFTEGTEKCD